MKPTQLIIRLKADVHKKLKVYAAVNETSIQTIIVDLLMKHVLNDIDKEEDKKKKD